MGKENRVRRATGESWKRPVILTVVEEEPLRSSIRPGIVNYFLGRDVFFGLVDVLPHIGKLEVWCDLGNRAIYKVDFTLPHFYGDHLVFSSNRQNFLPGGLPVRFKLPLPSYVENLRDEGVVRKGYYYMLECKTPETHCRGCRCMPFAEFEIPLAVRIEAWCERVL